MKRACTFPLHAATRSPRLPRSGPRFARSVDRAQPSRSPERRSPRRQHAGPISRLHRPAAPVRTAHATASHVNEPSPSSPSRASARRRRVDLEPAFGALLRGEVRLDALRVEHAEAWLRRDGGGRSGTRWAAARPRSRRRRNDVGRARRETRTPRAGAVPDSPARSRAPGPGERPVRQRGRRGGRFTASGPLRRCGRPSCADILLGCRSAVRRDGPARHIDRHTPEPGNRT